MFWQRLLNRGYPEAFLQPTFNSVQLAERQQYLQASAAAPVSAGSVPSILVFTDGEYEHQRMNLSKVVDSVYDKYKAALQELAGLFGDRVVVAYRNPPNLAKLLVRASH